MEVVWYTNGVERTDIISSESLTPEELRYLAGFFDGEGSVGLYYHRAQNQWKAKISISQNHSKHALRLFTRWGTVFAGNVFKRKCGDLELTIWKKASLVAFIRSVGPYCFGKKQQMIVLENWLQYQMYTHRTAQILKALKRS